VDWIEAVFTRIQNRLLTLQTDRAIQRYGMVLLWRKCTLSKLQSSPGTEFVVPTNTQALLGPAVAPCLAGVFAEYTAVSHHSRTAIFILRPCTVVHIGADPCHAGRTDHPANMALGAILSSRLRCPLALSHILLPPRNTMIRSAKNEGRNSCRTGSTPS
jgi:hypothetical protein